MITLPHRKLFTVNEYHKMIKAGIFNENSNFELIKGEILAKYSRSCKHEGCRTRIAYYFTRNLSETTLVSQICPIILSDHSEPETDIALLKFRKDYYSTGKPRPEDILLLIEVADTSTSADRRIKIPLYAGAEVPEVWLVNLPRKIVEVYTEPKNGKYKIVRKAGKSETISPKMIADLSVKAADIVG
jgi:Uma2 family endonuclease